MKRALPPILAVLSLFGFVVTAAGVRSGAQPTVVRLCILAVVLATVAVVSVSLVQRVRRTLAMPLPTVEFDPAAYRCISGLDDPPQLTVLDHDGVRDDGDGLLVEVDRRWHIRSTVRSGAPVPVVVTGSFRDGLPVLRVAAPEPARAVAALLLAVRDRTGSVPRMRFIWPEQHPAVPFVGWLFLGAGDLATMIRELLIRAEPDARRCPGVRVG